MKIILDTHIFLWALGEPDKLSDKELFEIEALSNLIYVSSISIAEIMIKSSLGKLTVNFDPIEMVEKSGFSLLDFNAKDACLLKELPYYHKDLFDRMLICQSKANKFHIMSNDQKFSMYDCKLIK